jgi:sensor histidine kinase regulating citrate/malate metabolism
MSLEKPGTSKKISNLLRPTKTAFDWISRNVYIVEKGNTIRTCNFEQKKCVSIASSQRDLIIEALATDPLAGFVLLFRFL